MTGDQNGMGPLYALEDVINAYVQATIPEEHGAAVLDYMSALTGKSVDALLQLTDEMEA